jgi:hypothetical protein
MLVGYIELSWYFLRKGIEEHRVIFKSRGILMGKEAIWVG